MSERDELIEQIEFLQWCKGRLTRKAKKIEKTDPARADQYDAWWNTASDEIGQLQDRLYEIEAGRSRREHIANVSYGRNP